MSNEDKIIKIQTPVNPVSQAEVVTPAVSVSNPDVSGQIRPTHTEVAVPEPLQGFMQQNPVAKLPDASNMQPTPPNFGSIKGDLKLPIPVADVEQLSRGSAQSGRTGLATVEKRQLDRAA